MDAAERGPGRPSWRLVFVVPLAVVGGAFGAGRRLLVDRGWAG